MAEPRERIAPQDESAPKFWKGRKLPLAGCGCLVILLILIIIIIFIPGILPPDVLNDGGVSP